MYMGALGANSMLSESDCRVLFSNGVCAGSFEVSIGQIWKIFKNFVLIISFA